MTNIDWLSTEAQRLHGIFAQSFFAMVTAFLLLAVALEFFRIPLGETPGFQKLVGRCFIAVFLMSALPEIMNFVAQATDSIAHEIGDLNQFKLVLGLEWPLIKATLIHQRSLGFCTPAAT